MQHARHFVFRHCFREENSVVDGFANHVIDTGSDSTFSDGHSIPQALKGHIFLDSIRTPHVRISGLFFIFVPLKPLLFVLR